MILSLYYKFKLTLAATGQQCGIKMMKTREQIKEQVKSLLGNDYSVTLSIYDGSIKGKLCIDWDRFFDRIAGNGWMWGNSEFIEFEVETLKPIRISGTNPIVIKALQCFPGCSELTKENINTLNC
jgi:hypothetical protein